MKLIHHTISKLSIVMIIILTFWAGFFFYSILDEILDETDDSLENYKHLIIQQVQRDTAAINNSSDLMSQYFIKEISENEAITKNVILIQPASTSSNTSSIPFES